MSFEILAPFRPSDNQKEAILLLLGGLFTLINAIALSLAFSGRLLFQHLYPVLVWIIAFSTLYVVLRRYRPGHDPYILPTIALLSGWGLVILDRLLPEFLHRQVIWLILASGILLIAILLPSSFWFFRRYRYLWLLTGLLLLVTTLMFGVNPSGYGAKLWLRLPLLGAVYFQPSELLKLLMVIFLASYFAEQELLSSHGLSTFRAGSLRNLAPLIVMWLFSMILLIWQRDLGAAALFFLVFLSMLYLSTGSWRYVLSGLFLLALGGAAAYLLYDVVAVRFDTWINPWPSAREQGYQIVQSLYALASGKMIGQGIGQGFPTYVPVVHTDFTFAALAEEWGLVGGAVAVFSFAFISFRGFRAAIKSTTTFRMYMAAGIAVMLGIQALLIMGGITRLLPLTGVTLPYVSYGGSSLVMSFLMAGLLLNLSVPESAYQRSSSQRLKPASTGSGIAKGFRDRLRHLNTVSLLAFLSIFLLLVYWTAVRGGGILARDDNPRLVEMEQRINRGSIQDSSGEILVESIEDSQGIQRRRYSAAGGPAVGYYSIDHGLAGVEAAADTFLRGNEENPWLQFLNSELLHEEQIGRDVRLTINSDWQELVTRALGSRPGAAVLLSLPEGSIRAAASYPGFDANTLDEQFDNLAEDTRGPLINRVVQGQYQPGLTIQPFVLAQAVQDGVVDLEASLGDPASFGDFVNDCQAGDSTQETWSDFLRDRCPGPMTALASEFGADTLYEVYLNFGLVRAPNLQIGERTDAEYEIADLQQAMIGQDTLAVSPIQLALAMSALGNQGILVEPSIIAAVQDGDGAWRPYSPQGNGERVITAASAQEILGAMSRWEGIIEHSITVLSGPEGATNSWYLALAPASAPRYALVLVLEDSDDLGEAEAAGRSMLKELLSGS